MSVQARPAELNPELYARTWAPKREAWTAPKHPAPEVPGRKPLKGEMPRTAAKLLKDAQAAGWTAVASYARGTSTDSQGNPTSVVESVAVRGRKNGLSFLAFWADGKFSSAWVWGILELRAMKGRELAKLVTLWP